MKRLIMSILIVMVCTAFLGLGLSGNAVGAPIIEPPYIPPATTLPPAAPSNFTATATSGTTVVLSWTDNSNNETDFSIERKKAGEAYDAVLVVLGANSTTHTDPLAYPGTTYYYRIRAHNAFGYSSYSNEVSVTTPAAAPAAPSNLDATAVSLSAINLSWTDNSNDETGFIIEGKVMGSLLYSGIETVGPNVTTYTHTGVFPGLTYYYRVKAINASGYSDHSNVATASITIPGPPAAPSNLVATAASSSAVNLSWTDNSGDETGFVIEAKAGSSDYSVIGAIGPNFSTYAHTGLLPNTTYYYRVKARNTSGDSGYTNEASATTPAADTVPPAPAPPAAPSSLVATAASSTAVNLSWTDNSGDETGFVIEAKAGGSDYSVIGAIGPNFSTYAHTGLSPDTTYYYRVKARNDSGDSDYTNEASATTPAATPVPPAPPAPEQDDFEIILQIGNPYMTVNGAGREIDPGRGTVPVILDNRTLVPIRAVVEAMGGIADWDATKAKVTVRLKDTIIELWIGSNTTRVNDEEKLTDVAPQLILHRTMLPLRFVSENLGCEVDWDGTGQKITIKPKL
ncbi:MAG: fibronectin type III domain-containing protein [Bacillota bacterium]